MSSNVRHQDIVKNLINAKAVDFAAIGKIVAEMGPSIAVLDEPWEGFCGTMRTFVHVYKIHTAGTPVENLADLGAAAGGLKA